jgi:hypothetical protein
MLVVDVDLACKIAEAAEEDQLRLWAEQDEVVEGHPEVVPTS